MTLSQQYTDRGTGKFPISISSCGSTATFYFSKESNRNKFCNNYKEYKEKEKRRFARNGIMKDGTIYGLELATKYDDELEIRGCIVAWLEKIKE